MRASGRAVGVCVQHIRVRSATKAVGNSRLINGVDADRTIPAGVPAAACNLMMTGVNLDQRSSPTLQELVAICSEARAIVMALRIEPRREDRIAVAGGAGAQLTMLEEQLSTESR